MQQSESTTHVTIVIPCYNEAERLRLPEFTAFLEANQNVRCVFVDDGSTDGTGDMLIKFAAANDAQVRVLSQSHNTGKAEAVRHGLLAALETPAKYVGYWDADMSTPLADIVTFVDVLESMPKKDVVFGARVQLLGRDVQRSNLRHYLGRIFATLVSEILNLPVYDTQCGAKLFRVNETLRQVLAEPFMTRWIFDVEIIKRYAKLHGDMRDRIYELPLQTWRDVRGSKIRIVDFLRVPLELWKIWRV